ncbi:NAD(P) transhydrogenase subunit alpha [Hufsiella ginkgonis]|uniref:proton-translocating NAD(P)(+) transhydrogenase n=1 Tax=Hufsiella ginkgonis TaxID=2695274 RepID=A0A7K1XYS4_9SPHI|nr:NAD(P) transhydrogenase subunit alpha [Hufsiella ginkgonis]MXV15978.1 NAD(P)(+) transhydrogenase (Re/Si-specific) subunit alpha [Hufsiella ginkgonis]
MIIAILKEPAFESRVSLLPDEVAALLKRKVTVWVEPGAGSGAFCTDDDYVKQGALLRSAAEIFAEADLLLAINHPALTPGLKNKVLAGVYQPLYHPGLMAGWAVAGHTVFSLDMLPRTTRAQSMDVLSSQANIAGYKAVLLAAAQYPRYFPMLMTAAGSIAPAKVLILGAGVAGLQAVATSRRLGAVVEVFDTRPAVKEEVMSLGARFVEVEGTADVSQAGGYAVEQSEEFARKQKACIAASIARADIVITTAQIFGKKAPVLVTAEMIGTMRAGSVIIDLAVSTGGNTELSKDNEHVVHGGVTIIGDSNLAASLPFDASKLYGKNVMNFLKLIIDDTGALNLNFGDDLVKGACMLHDGAITNERLNALQA